MLIPAFGFVPAEVAIRVPKGPECNFGTGQASTAVAISALGRGRGAFLERWSSAVMQGGVQGRENVGMSSKKAGENPAHRKFKVSWATQIDPGLVGPKARSV